MSLGKGREKMRVIVGALLLTLMLAVPAVAAGLDIEMLYVKGGCYQMGSNEGKNDEQPVHEVCVSSFSMGKYLVTQAQWMAVMGNNPSNFNGDRRPVERVSWDDVQEFIGKLNAQTGMRYRLPTEAEWEYAARSGGKLEKWAGTNDESSLVEYAWFDKNSGEKTHVVGTKKPNGLGLYDMAGNVLEWCQDWFGDVYYEESPRDNPHGPQTGSFRVSRGGGWGYSAGGARASFRGSYDPGIRYVFLGFRLVAPVQ